MNIVTAAITTAISAISENFADKIIIDSYKKLLEVLKKKYGESSEVVVAISLLEKKPESSTRKEMLEETVNEINVDQNTEIVKIARKLLDHSIDINLESKVIRSRTDDFFRLAGDSTTDAPPPRPKSRRN
jgi:hypothetical protein